VRLVRILVTRPIGEAAAFADALRQRGHVPVVSPALVMQHEPGEKIGLARYRAVLITSANAVRALAARTPQRDATLLCVGPASAAAARGEGFSNVLESAGEGAEGLSATVEDSLGPGDGPLLYPSARDIAGNLERELTAKGFVVVRQIVYRMDYAARLSPEAETALAQGGLDAVAYFSARSAGATQQAARASGLEAELRALTAICLSQAVEAKASAMHRRTLSAASATEAAMLQAIDSARRSGL
jgi:uroporphyrinogen-III synthase